MKVKGYDPSPAIDNIHQLSPEVKICRSLKDCVGDADIVSIHLPLNDKTRNLVNAEFIGKFKRGAVLVNYSREQIRITSYNVCYTKLLRSEISVDGWSSAMFSTTP